MTQLGSTALERPTVGGVDAISISDRRGGPNFIYQSLAEQMKISDAEIASRKALFQLTDNEEATLAECRGLVEPHIDEIVDRFYTQMTGHFSTQLLIGDLETFTRLQASMKGYVQELFAGEYGREYVNKRLRIGKVHERIGVDPKLYVSAVHLLDGILTEFIGEALRQRNEGAQVAACCGAVRKLLMFDIHIVFDTYTNSLVSQVDVARQELERYAQDLESIVADRTRQLRDLSHRDELTGLYNQRAFFSHLNREVASASRYGTALSLGFFDLNNFKALNDEMGHFVGDKILQIVGEVLTEGVRETDFACRYGGDEFAVILPNTTSDFAVSLFERLTTAFDSHGDHGVTFSVGIVELGPDSARSGEELLREADSIMYQAKLEARASTERRHWIRKGPVDADSGSVTVLQDALA